jgi:hypothetical protein
MGVVRRPEAGRVDRWTLVALDLQRRKRNAARLADAARPGAIRQDPEDPMPQGRAALELLQALQHAEPRLLHDFFRDGTAGDECRGDAEHGGVQALDGDQEGLFVAGSQRGERALLLGSFRRDGGPCFHPILDQTLAE